MLHAPIVYGDVYECIDYVTTNCRINGEWTLFVLQPKDLVIPIVESNSRCFCVFQSDLHGTFVGDIGPNTVQYYLRPYS